MYQKTKVLDATAVGEPGDLPVEIATWGTDLGLLADLTGKAPAEFGFDGFGFWPVDISVPTFDPLSQIAEPPTACDSADPVAHRWSATATIRDMTDDEFIAANPVPSVISDRQFFQQLAIDGDITNDEALAAVMVGTMPQKISDAVNALPSAEQFGAKMALCGATSFQRNNYYVGLLEPIFSKTSRQIDDIWRKGASII